MGRTLLRLAIEAEDMTLAGGLEQAGSAVLGHDLGTLAGVGELGLVASDDPLAALAGADALVDFFLARRFCGIGRFGRAGAHCPYYRHNRL